MPFFNKEIRTALFELKSTGNSIYLYKVLYKDRTSVKGIEKSMTLKGEDDKYHPLMFPTYVTKDIAKEMLEKAGKPTENYSDLVQIINEASRLDPQPDPKATNEYETGVVVRIIPYEKDPTKVIFKTSKIAHVKSMG